MRFLIIVTVLLSAQYVRGASVNGEASGMSGLDSEEIRNALKVEKSASEVLEILKQAKSNDIKVYGRGNVSDYISLSERKPQLCNLGGLKRVVSLHPTYNTLEFRFLPMIRDNVARYCRQQFDGLFEYCLAETQGKAFSEQVKKFYHEQNSNTVFVPVNENTKLEKLLMEGVIDMDDIHKRDLDMDSVEIRKALNVERTGSEVLEILLQAKDKSGKLYGQGTVADFISLSERRPQLCNLEGLKRIVSLHPTYNNKEFSFLPMIRDNVARYCRQQLDELFDYCLKETQGKAFTEQMRNLHNDESDSSGLKLDESTKLEKLIMEA